LTENAVQPNRMRKIADPYYKSPEWIALRHKAMERDHHHCTTPGCMARATRVDHIISRKAGGMDALSNLRCLCTICDNKMREYHGKRRSGGKAIVTGIDGWPVSN
jgi:5-methylcytosine-specific restriction endonuclease McrA